MTQAYLVRPAESLADLKDAARLFRAYAAALPVDLGYQGFEAELAALPGKYAPPAGALLIARSPAGEAIGCVAMRPTDAGHACEMKRLYVTPGARGLGLGGALIGAIVGQARAAGYEEIWLDTLPTMHAALAMYARAGFTPIDAYYPTPVEGTVFLALRLEGSRRLRPARTPHDRSDGRAVLGQTGNGYPPEIVDLPASTCPHPPMRPDFAFGHKQ